MSAPLIIDSFAGGGGASTGIEMALGRSPDIAINHDGAALAMHLANHPNTLHITENVWTCNIDEYTRGRPVGLLWASPDCRHFSKARGAAPTSKSVRGLAWSIVKFVHQLGRNKPEVIVLENVEEFAGWEDFPKWKKELKRYGFVIDMRELRACDYGAPTIRKRLFIIMRSDGLPIVWPEPTHAPASHPDVIAGRKLPWRSAASIIDWSVPCPSIFDTSENIMEKYGLKTIRPLADNTMARVAKGMKKYVLDAAEPFIISVAHGESGDGRVYPIDDPIRTLTGKNDKALVMPIITAAQHGGSVRSATDPIHTIAASRKDQNAVIAAFVSRQFGNSIGHEMQEPAATATGQNKSALVAAFLAQHNTGVIGRAAGEPMPTITQRGTQQMLVGAHLMSLKGTDRRDSSLESPHPTVLAGGGHSALVSAFMVKYYGAGIAQPVDEPFHTITAKPRFGLVTVQISGVPYVVMDIGMRMLTPRELFLAQGFPADYIIDPIFNGKRLTKSEQVGRCGNSVSPFPAAAIVAANCGHLIEERVAA